MTPHRRLFREANEYCGIRKGISKAEMMDKMKNCIPEFFKDRKAAKIEVEEQWIEVLNGKGELIGWEPLDPKTGLAIPERRILVASGQKPPREATGFRLEE